MAEPIGRGEAVRQPKGRTPRRVLTVVAALAAVPCGVLILVVLVSIAGRYLGGPQPVTPDAAGIIGTWRGSGGAELVFHSDGTYDASGMPDMPEVELPADGHGTWAVDPWKVRTGSGGGVDLTSGIVESMLNTSGNPAHPSLLAFIGDPGDGHAYSFERQH